MRRTDDFDVEAVSIVPPVIERRGSEHGNAAPGSDERAQRSAESKNVHGRSCQRGVLGESGVQYQITKGNTRENTAQINSHMGGSPKRIPANGFMPRNVPITAHGR